MDQSSYQSYGGMDRPLFGERNRTEKFVPSAHWSSNTKPSRNVSGPSKKPSLWNESDVQKSSDLMSKIENRQNLEDRYISYGLGIVTVAVVIAVVISAFVKLAAVNILLAVIIILNCISNILLIYWYREGDLEPKFRYLIYYNFLVTLLLCIIAFIIIF